MISKGDQRSPLGFLGNYKEDSMTSKIKKAGWSISLISALLLALSLFLPLAEYSTYVDDAGKPLGLVGQLFSKPGSEQVATYGSFWDAMHWEGVIFLVPLLLVALKRWGPRYFHPALTVVTPLIAAFLLAILLTIVEFTDLGIWPWVGVNRAYGGYVALGALGSFFVTTSIVAVSAFIQVCGKWRKKKREMKS
jgi:hypothetical protein